LAGEAIRDRQIGTEGKKGMRISALEEYGLRCMLALARQNSGEQLSITEMAEMEGLSVPYVSKLLSTLRKAGLVTAVRGRGGGFGIARDPKDINLFEVLTLLGGPLIDPNHCQKRSGQRETCVHLDDCSLHDVLGGLAGYIQEFLMSTSLEDLARGRGRGFVRRLGDGITLSRDALGNELKTNTNSDFEQNLKTLSSED